MSGKGKLLLRGSPIRVFLVITICVCSMAIHYIGEGLLLPGVQLGSEIAGEGGSFHSSHGDSEDNFVFPSITPMQAETLVFHPHPTISTAAFTYCISPLLPPPNS